MSPHISVASSLTIAQRAHSAALLFCEGVDLAHAARTYRVNRRHVHMAIDAMRRRERASK